MSKRQQEQAQQNQAIQRVVPGKHLGWTAAELDKAGVPYQVQRGADGYHIQTGGQGAPVIDGVLGYQAKGNRNLSLGQRIKSELQKMAIALRQIVIFMVIVVVLLTGVQMFGLGHLSSTFGRLYPNGTGSMIPVIRAVGILVVLGGLLFVLNKTVGQPPGGPSVGEKFARKLDVILWIVLVVGLLLAWAGKLGGA